MQLERWRLHLTVAFLAIAAMTLALTPAVADPVPDTDEYPDVAFLARNDVPFDAQTAASMAAQLGAPMFITSPSALSDAAANGISDLDPDVLVVAGGEFAISEDVANAAAVECDPDCTIDRRFGAGRDQTAAALAEIAADYGFDRPVLQGNDHVAGDVHVDGTVSANALTVEDTGLVSGLNADRLDGRDDYFHPDNDGSGSGLDADTVDGQHASAFAASDHQHAASFDSATSLTAVGAGSTTFEDIPGMSTSVTIPSGHTGIIVARFTAESDCTTAGSSGSCQVRIVQNGTDLDPTFANFDHTGEGTPIVSHTAQAVSSELGAGTYTVKAQGRTSNSEVSFGVWSRSLVTEVELTD